MGLKYNQRVLFTVGGKPRYGIIVAFDGHGNPFVEATKDRPQSRRGVPGLGKEVEHFRLKKSDITEVT